MQDFIITAAIPIMATGIIKMAPPTKSKHTISKGRASTIRILATIFAMPHVSLSAKPMDLLSSHTKMIMVNNSNISIASFGKRLFAGIHFNQMGDELIFSNKGRVIKLISATVLTTCVTAKEMQIINDKRSKEKNKKK